MEGFFQGRKISAHDSFRRHLNRYDVIRIDVQWCLTSVKSGDKTVSYIEKNVIEELRELFPEAVPEKCISLPDTLAAVHKRTGQKFIVIIDEWDALIRDEAENAEVQEEYITLLRELFKGANSTEFIHLAYLTGILPIKKIRTQSALNDFDEFTMLDAKIFAAAVADIIEEIHMGYASTIQYNNENSLSSVLSIAYLGAMNYYFKPVRELPAGRGFADIVFLPRKEYPELPALLVELKWNKSADAAISQIKDRKYAAALERYTGEILLVGINYSKKDTRHQCLIEKYSI